MLHIKMIQNLDALMNRGSQQSDQHLEIKSNYLFPANIFRNVGNRNDLKKSLKIVKPPYRY